MKSIIGREATFENNSDNFDLQRLWSWWASIGSSKDSVLQTIMMLILIIIIIRNLCLMFYNCNSVVLISHWNGKSCSYVDFHILVLLLQAMFFSAMMSLGGLWYTPHERSILTSISCNGECSSESDLSNLCSRGKKCTVSANLEWESGEDDDILATKTPLFFVEMCKNCKTN